MNPFPAFNFVVSLIDSSSTFSTITSAAASIAAGFSECSGLEMTMDIEEFREGGNNGTVLRFPTRVKFGNLRLKRGVSLGNDLFPWQSAFAQGQVQRRDGVITLLNELHLPVKAWTFRRGLPVRWSGPPLNASQSQVAIEELEIAHEGLTQI